MRRLLTLLTVVALMSLPIVGSATTGNDNYLDRFQDGDVWTGSDGSILWPSPWKEIGDDGDSKKGSVQVVSSDYCVEGKCMLIDASVLPNVGARRMADLSFFREGELCFDLNVVAGGLEVGSNLLVQVTTDGSNWTPLATYQLSESFDDHEVFDLSEYLSVGFGVRFKVTGLLTGSQVYIDNVEISGPTSEPTTTTTTVTEPTSTSSTTTITVPTTTTTHPRSATTSTTAPAAATTTAPATTTTTVSVRAGSDVTTTSTTTTTTVAADQDGSDQRDEGAVVAIASGGPPAASGLRAAARGLQANFDGKIFGKVKSTSPDLTETDFHVSFAMATEVIQSSWAWMILLGLTIAWAIVTGVERRKFESAISRLRMFAMRNGTNA